MAQNDTVPALLNGIEGGTGTAIPFGVSGAARVQYIYDVEDLPFTGPRLITRVSLRADNSIDNSTTFAQKGFLFVSMLLSTTTARAETASTTFESNYGSDATLVIDNLPIVLPAQPPMAGPRPANIDFVLTTPWFYGLTPTRPQGQPMPTSLLVEIRVHSQPTGLYRLDNTGNCSIPPVSFGQLGPACQSIPGSQLGITAGSSMAAGSNYTWQVDNALANAPVMLFVGVDPQQYFGGFAPLPLPVPLFDLSDPNRPNPQLAALFANVLYGAPDCWVNVSPMLMLIANADQNGLAQFTLPVPASRLLVGASVYAQALAYSQTANPLLVTSSLGLRSTVCGPLGVARIYALGSDGATTGQWGFGQGAVLELH